MRSAGRSVDRKNGLGRNTEILHIFKSDGGEVSKDV